MIRNNRLALSLLAAVAAAGLIGCSKQEAPKPVEPAAPPAASAPAAPEAAVPKAIFEQKCSVCHNVDRATSRTETRDAWAALVKKMQAKQPGSITDDEAAKIVDFLVAEHGK